LTWVDENAQSISQLRTYVLNFQKVKPSVFDYFVDGATAQLPLAVNSDRGVAFLLYYCALKQEITEKKLMGLLVSLWNFYEADLFKINRLPFDELQSKILLHQELKDWEFLPKAAGILRSVSDFFYHFGKILPWIMEKKSGEKSIQILSDEIFMMGKTSVLKSKARYFLWLLTQIFESETDTFWDHKTLVLTTPGHTRALREFGPLKNRKSTPWTTTLGKTQYLNRFYNLLFPNQSWKVYTAFDLYLKPLDLNSKTPLSSPSILAANSKTWKCKIILKGCINCVLAPTCPGRDDVQ